MTGRLDDSDNEALFDSPSKKPTGKDTDRPKTPSKRYDDDDIEDRREASLRRELDGVRNINELIEGVIGTLERAKGNMQTVSGTVTTASTLLNSWTRILSQTEHNQRLILNPTWKGATQDLADVENEAAERQAAAERRAIEEERRRNEVKRRAEEESRAREAAANTRSNTRGSVRSRTTRTRGSSSRGSTSGPYGYSSARGTSGIGRGVGTTRGRARGS